MSYQFKGIIKEIFETQEFASGFKKREFVVTSQGDYPSDIKFEILKDKVSMLDKYGVGQEVTVDFNLSGNEHNGKYYNNLQAWKMNSDNEAPPQEAKPEAPATTGSIEADLDDLPF